MLRSELAARASAVGACAIVVALFGCAELIGVHDWEGSSASTGGAGGASSAASSTSKGGGGAGGAHGCLIPDANPCGDLVQQATAAVATLDGGAPPTELAGGELADGVYVMTSWTKYGSGSGPLTASKTIRIADCGKQLEIVYDADSTKRAGGKTTVMLPDIIHLEDECLDAGTLELHYAAESGKLDILEEDPDGNHYLEHYEAI